MFRSNYVNKEQCRDCYNADLEIVTERVAKWQTGLKKVIFGRLY